MSTIFTESWTGTNGDPWSALRWGTGTTSGTVDIQGNRGRLEFQSSFNASARAWSLVSATDSEVVVDFEFPSVGITPSLVVGLRTGTTNVVGRPTDGYIVEINARAGGGWPARLQCMESGTATQLDSVAFDPAASTVYRLRFQVDGDTIRAKWWVASGSEPVGWNLSATDDTIEDAGRLWVSLHRDAGTWEVLLDDLTWTDLGAPVPDPTPEGRELLTDAFTGTNNDPPNPSRWDVFGPGTATIQSDRLRLRTDSTDDWARVETLGVAPSVDGEVLVRVQASNVGDVGPGVGLRVADRGGDLAGYWVTLEDDDATLWLVTDDWYLLDDAPLAVSTLDDLWVRFQTVGSTIRAKVWKVGTAEPGSWTVTTTDSTITDAGQASLRADAWAGGPHDVWYDQFTFSTFDPFMAVVTPVEGPDAVGLAAVGEAPVREADLEPDEASDTVTLAAESARPVTDGALEPVEQSDGVTLAAGSTRPVREAGLEPSEAADAVAVAAGSTRPQRAAGLQPVEGADTATLTAEAARPVRSAGLEPGEQADTVTLTGGSTRPLRDGNLQPDETSDTVTLAATSERPQRAGSLEPDETADTVTLTAGSTVPHRTGSLQPVEGDDSVLLLAGGATPTRLGNLEPAEQADSVAFAAGSTRPVREASLEPSEQADSIGLAADGATPERDGTLQPVEQSDAIGIAAGSTRPVRRAALDPADLGDGWTLTAGVDTGDRTASLHVVEAGDGWTLIGGSTRPPGPPTDPVTIPGSHVPAGVAGRVDRAGIPGSHVPAGIPGRR